MSTLPVGDSEVGEVNDLATLAKLDESILLNEVKARYQNDRIYTYVGDILVSVNPFQDLGIYGKDFSDTYRNVKRREDEPPHIYAVADRLYQDMRGIRGTDAKNQCVLISGESGAGKTECTKLIIKQLIDLCQGNNQLQQQILQVNPLLEAFGNAQTLMNDNSSRFGKYIQLKFVEGRVLGAKISEYLLEKSRMVRQSEGEANFHIFYYMFAGLSVAEQTQYKLQDVDNYKYFSDGADCLQTDAKLLKERYEELINAIDMVGFTDKEQEDMFAILAATLTVGNIEVGADDIGVAVVSESSSHIKDVTDLLGLDNMEMHSCISCSITFTKGEQIRRNYTVAQSEEARDAVAKALYGRLFSWIVNRINTLLVPREFFNPDKVQEIGILDIFGFEHFELNSFEQACINLANEQLQFFFNKHIFMLEQEEYRGEGINWKEIKFVDNKSLLDLFLGRPIGILALLDEESFFPKGSDQSYVAKMNQKFAKNPHYIQSTQGDAKSFTIAHYAGHVTYDSTDWLEKNRDTLPPGVMEMLQQSTNKLLSLIFKGKISRTGTLALNHKTTKKSKFNQPLKAAEATKHRKLTVGHQFKNSLSVLMERMTQSQPVFIRCIKPNSKKSPKLFEDEYVKAQLLYTGMLETTKIRREGFAIRPSFREFVERYKLLIHVFKLEPTAKNCKKILDSTKLTGCQIGKTKVFLKYWHLDKLAELMEVLAKQAVHMQRVVRGYLGRQRTKRLRKEAAKKAQEVKNLLHQVEKNSTTAMNDQNKMLNGDKSVPKDFFDKNKNTTTAPRILSFGGTDLTGGASNDGKVKLRHNQNGQQVDSDSDAEDEFVPLDPEELAKFGKPGTKAAAMNWFLETQKSTVRHSEDGFAEWFHGFISRRDAEKLLKNSSVGCFLIRISESRIGYSLSFRAKDRSRHYMIDQLPNGKLIVVGENKVHRTLHYLTDYLKTHMLSNWDGYLTEPCGQLPGQCDYAELLDENDKEYVEYRSSRVGTLPPLPDRNYSLAGMIRGSLVNSIKLPTKKDKKKH